MMIFFLPKTKWDKYFLENLFVSERSMVIVDSVTQLWELFYFLHSLLKIDSKILQVLCNFFFCSIYCLLLFFLLEKLIWSCFMDFRVCERLQRDIFGKNLLSGKFATTMAKLPHTVFKLIYSALSFGFLILLLYVCVFIFR